jgi:hypothetical protein
VAVHYSKLLVLATLSVISAVANSADSVDLDWCRKAANDLVGLAYKRNQGADLDNGRIESEVLDERIKDEQVTGKSSAISKMTNRALYLRSRTNTPQSEAVTDVYALCANLTSGDGRGRSRVYYGEDVEPSQAEKEAAWDSYYRPGARCDNPSDWEVTVECGNERIRARAEFDRKWSKGEIRGTKNK